MLLKQPVWQDAQNQTIGNILPFARVECCGGIVCITLSLFISFLRVTKSHLKKKSYERNVQSPGTRPPLYSRTEIRKRPRELVVLKSPIGNTFKKRVLNNDKNWRYAFFVTIIYYLRGCLKLFSWDADEILVVSLFSGCYQHNPGRIWYKRLNHSLTSPNSVLRHTELPLCSIWNNSV